MASTTGIEVKPDSCVLVGVRPSRAVTNVFALHLMEPAASALQDSAIVAALRSVRSRKRLPRSARVVVWGVPDPVALDNPTTLMALQPFTSAGFRIVSVVTPPQALAALAATRPRQAGSSAVAWLAINMNGAAIAIVHGADLLYARSFDWLYEPGSAGSAGQLLQRYTLVAHLAPEVREGIAKVQSDHPVTVETAITCGDLPDLRSLTMPLIEELDLEVETLDSVDGLRATGRARRERFAESAPAIRLACAVGAAPAVERPPQGDRPRSYALAAATAAVALAGVGYVYWSAPASVDEKTVAPATHAAPLRGPAPTGASGRPGSSIVTSPKATGPAPSTVPAPKPSAQPGPPLSPGTHVGRASPPAVDTVARETPAPRQPVPGPPPQSAPPPGQPAVVPVPRQVPPPFLPAAPPTEVASRPMPTPEPHPRTQVSQASPAPVTPRGAASMAPTPPMNDPLPRIDSILIDRGRRLAIVDGGIVTVGDEIGPRIVARIEPEAVFLREPSGIEVRVPLRSGPLR